jgi:hypothetical protein
MKPTLLVIYLALACINAYAQTLAPPVPDIINSDFGPRNIGNNYGWHPAIDYCATLNTPVQAVEAGNIVQIDYEGATNGHGGGGWYITIHSATRFWTYMHLFNDDRPPVVPGYEVRDVTFINPATINNPHPETEIRRAVIVWENRTLNRANRVLIVTVEDNPLTDWWVLSNINQTPPFYYILNTSGVANINPQNYVGAGVVIAPSGNSGQGGYGAHLDLRSGIDLNVYTINPLYNVEHAVPNYLFEILLPLQNGVLYQRPAVVETQQINERIQVRVLSEGRGVDLDRVFVYFFNSDISPTERIFDDAHKYGAIIYGGLPSTIDNNLPFPDYVDNSNMRGGINLRTGVDPLDYTDQFCSVGLPTSLGRDDFYFLGNFTQGTTRFSTKIREQGISDAITYEQAKFNDGKKTLVARAYSITHEPNNQDRYFDAERQVYIDNFRPFVEKVTVGPYYSSEWVLSDDNLIKSLEAIALT